MLSPPHLGSIPMQGTNQKQKSIPEVINSFVHTDQGLVKLTANNSVKLILLRRYKGGIETGQLESPCPKEAVAT